MTDPWRMPPNPDSLAPFRGILNGLALALPFWVAAVGVLAWVAR